MSLLKFTAKVNTASEEQMETENTYKSMQNAWKDKEWSWNRIAVPVEQADRIIEYTPKKCIVLLYSGEKILAAELFDELTAKWEFLRREDNYTPPKEKDLDLGGPPDNEDEDD